MTRSFLNLDNEYSKRVKIELSRHLDVNHTDVDGLDSLLINAFCLILQYTESVISGDFIVKQISNFEDEMPFNLTIYANFEGALEINDFLRNNNIVDVKFQQEYISYEDETDCKRKTYINSILLYHMPLVKFVPKIAKFIKIVVLDTNTTPENFISNMGLTFCQVLFNGVVVKATNPDDIFRKSGTLMEHYVPLLNEGEKDITEQIKNYTKRGFEIKIPPIDIKKQIWIPLTSEEMFIAMLYKNVWFNLANNDRDFKYEIMGNADIFINFLYLRELSIDVFFEFLRKLADDVDTNCILPFEVKDLYSYNKTTIVKVLAIYYGSLSDVISDMINSGVDIEVVVDFNSQVLEIMEIESIDHFEEIEKKFEFDIVEYFKMYVNEEKQDLYLQLKHEERAIDMITYLKKRLLLENRRKFPNTRNIEWLNIVKPSQIDTIKYKENKFITCNDIITMEDYNINSYLKGYSDSNLESVPPEEAIKRLVFFVAKSAYNLSDLTPYCYNMDLIGIDAGHDLFIECEGKNKKGNLLERFTKFTPIIRLIKLTGWPIYIRLDEFLYALYKTKKQTFILIPTDKGFGYNASLSNGYEIDNISADHCQEGTEKKILYTIKTCSGDGEDLCWPVNTKLSLELVEDFEPNTFFLQEKFYILDKEQNIISNIHEESIAENNPMNKDLDAEDGEQLESDYDAMVLFNRNHLHN